MRPLLLASIFAAALAGSARAQSVTCRDGTVLSGANSGRMCVAHGGLPPGTSGNPSRYARQPADASQPVQQPRTAPRDVPQGANAAPGGGPSQVWVNTSSKAYHCPGTRYYGKTKQGEYMTEVAAKAAGAHAAGGRTCS